MNTIHRFSYVLPSGLSFVVESGSSEQLGEVSEALRYQYPGGLPILSQHARKGPVDAPAAWSKERCAALADAMAPGEWYGPRRYGALKLDSEAEMRAALFWMEQYGFVTMVPRFGQSAWRRTKK